MGEFLANPRRAPRAPARCHATVTARHRYDVETEDVGPRGCQVVLPTPLERGSAVRVDVWNDDVPEPLRVGGRVAWASPRPPWRVGIAFADAEVAASTRWFERLVRAHPRYAAIRRLPDRIPVDALLFLARPPRHLVDFSGDEAAVLRVVATGATLRELQARFGARWPGAQRALFSLLARSAVTLSRGASVHPSAWRAILAEGGAAEPATPLAIPAPPRDRGDS